MKKQKKVSKAAVADDDESGLSSKEKLLRKIARDKAQKRKEAEDYWDGIRDHVMLGELKDGTIKGFHSVQKLGQPGCVARLADGEIKRLKMNCYTRSIQAASGDSKKESTFFPDLWTEADIRAAVIDAYLHQVKGVGSVTIPKGNGMGILFMGDGTAFPFFG